MASCSFSLFFSWLMVVRCSSSCSSTSSRRAVTKAISLPTSIALFSAAALRTSSSRNILYRVHAQRLFCGCLPAWASQCLPCRTTLSLSPDHISSLL
ncbi:hypothetical protein PVAP13_1KG138610 [Panicum virgatum]|uniref:Secreted protein n=1 Tax=Panicum virgatum TaxID=38727 RepID=A0A8T0XQW2_PANVG|nr:hypothetical protein PVAP13_1KG138610 [Panicum virgatum]